MAGDGAPDVGAGEPDAALENPDRGPSDAAADPGAGAAGGRAARGRPRWLRAGSALAVLAVAMLHVPVAAAHGGAHQPGLEQSHGVAGLLAGGALVVGAVAGKRTGRITPTTALYGVLAGLVVATIGAIVFDGTSPDPTYAASTMPIPRSFYPALALLTGVGIAVASFAVGWIRWPTRPRYTFLGILVGLWVAYPSLVPGTASLTHPLGYLIVLSTPVAVGYVLWTDARHAIRTALGDVVARRFGIGVGLVLATYFTSMSGYLTVFPDEAAPHHTVVAVRSVLFQLVTWPTLEVYLPQIPFFVAISGGAVVLVGLLSVLVGLNAALIAYQWRVEGAAVAGTTEGAAGTTAIVGSCACGCCGPIVAQIAVLAAGPSIAAPLYWVFVDSASPFTMLFLVASFALFTAGLVYGSKGAPATPESPSGAPAD